MDYKVYYKDEEVCELPNFETCLEYIMNMMEVDRGLSKNDFKIYRKLYPL